MKSHCCLCFYCMFACTPIFSSHMRFVSLKNSMALVRERTISTERPSLADEISAKFLRIEGVALSAQRTPRPYFRISRLGIVSYPKNIYE
jgi:hypothetical protein